MFPAKSFDPSWPDSILFDALPAAVYVCEAGHGTIVRYNRRAAELWGREPATGPGGDRFDGAFRLYTPEGERLPHDRSPMAGVLLTSRIIRGVDVVIERPDGARLTVAMTVSPLRDAHGILTGAVAVFHEVSERRRAEERERMLLQASALLGSTLDHRTILDQLARLALKRYADWCLIEVLEDDGQVRGMAGAHVQPDREPLVAELAGIPGALGPGVVKILQSGQPHLLTIVPRSFADEVASDPRHRELLRLLAPESLLAVPLQARGRIFGLVAFVLAGSQRRYEPADLPLAEGIARRAALAIDNARLYRESQQANRLKDEFLATLSHELRTPLNAILGWTQLLLTRQLEGADAERALQTIRRNAEAQTRLTGDILDVSRIITGRLGLNLRPLNLAAVIHAAVDAVRPAAEARELRLTVDVKRSPAFMLGDPDRLQQVVWNLLSNAVKFTPAGGRVAVTVTTKEKTVRIQVADTGAGIPPQFLPALFERFRQADSSSSRTYGGLGLGLAIVRHLVELHGGSVAGESAGENRGATFTVTLPVQVAQAPSPRELAPLARRQRERLSVESPPRLTGLKVLVVDDDPDSRGLARAVLEGLGADVQEATSAASALEQVGHSWPDVLVADIGMPQQDGFSLLVKIREIEMREGRRLPAVAVTAYARDTDRDRALGAGFNAYLPKPATPEDLANAVARVTGRFARS